MRILFIFCVSLDIVALFYTLLKKTKKVLHLEKYCEKINSFFFIKKTLKKVKLAKKKMIKRFITKKIFKFFFYNKLCICVK